jgi:hypothetical protein
MDHKMSLSTIECVLSTACITAALILVALDKDIDDRMITGWLAAGLAIQLIACGAMYCFDNEPVRFILSTGLPFGVLLNATIMLGFQANIPALALVSITTAVKGVIFWSVFWCIIVFTFVVEPCRKLPQSSGVSSQSIIIV